MCKAYRKRALKPHGFKERSDFWVKTVPEKLNKITVVVE